MTDEIFARICRDNPELGFELTASGELIVVTPSGSQSGHRELRILQRLGEWTEPVRVVDPRTLAGDPVLPGFRFDFSEIARTE